MTIKVKQGRIYLEWGWGGLFELSLSGAKLFVQLLLDAIDEVEKGQSVRKQL